MAQFARPSADLTRNTWVTNANGTANLWATMDEDPASETDFVQGSLTVNDFYEFRLSTVTAALIDRLHIFRYRGRKNAAGGNVRGVMAELRQGTTVIASNSHPALTEAWADGIIQLTPAQGAAITNYADLRGRYTSTGVVSGTSGVRRRIQMSWCQFRVPDWQPVWENDWGAVEDTTTPGVVRLILDGIQAEGATPEEARLILAERLRDRVLEQWVPNPDLENPDPFDPDTFHIGSPYDDPVYQQWSRVRQPMARFAKKLVDYTAYRPTLTEPADIASVDAKLAVFAQRIAALEALERV